MYYFSLFMNILCSKVNFYFYFCLAQHQLPCYCPLLTHNISIYSAVNNYYDNVELINNNYIYTSYAK